MKHLKTLLDWQPSETEAVLETARDLKASWKAGKREAHLAGHVITMLFEKPSLRTRHSFETAMIHLGGGGIFLTTQEAGLKGRESLADVARVVSSYSDFVAIRTFSQKFIDEFADWSSCPVINALSDSYHPCQALTDIFTMSELFDDYRERRLVYVGDGNNVVASLAIITAQLGMPITICTPAGFELDPELLKRLCSKYPNWSVNVTNDVDLAVKEADVVYTDVWASMGQESEEQKRKKIFEPYQINEKLMAKTPKHCQFLHCLPAHRGDEVTDGVMDSGQSAAFLQAENRMHLAKGLMLWLKQQQ
ncbi:Ornithine carbamoyltransferase [Polystyrenella longa]|uniref:Ornithine carbamoyltransferase n=1 Tax=Polystyrenella longa TaxID=2528007 RepID=A0A518CPP9_9PLAN|nr:ornithine carbamoyltransferase [Polystyrenella longa]QDU81205.1 Ornithine carbamoyltransferase [Polystyrenella longa]